ncbi:pyridoxal-phosphate dependent enzyme [Streptomyces massasporeus]|uniref:pyridoxal-phosphate dependent enzyme n=1 Tax=Streptomyces massasporeus TaxID=67324 RepID=UPI003409AE9B
MLSVWCGRARAPGEAGPVARASASPPSWAGHRRGLPFIGVCAAGAPAMATSRRTGVPEATGPVSTMADGITVRVPVPTAVAWMREVVDDVLLVEEDIRLAPRTVRDALGLILEPSGAVGIAAALRHDLGTAPLGTILTGGNYSPGLLAELAPDPARVNRPVSA